MKKVYTGIHKIGRSESFAVFAISFAAVAAYSFWGAHILQLQGHVSSPQVASVNK